MRTRLLRTMTLLLIGAAVIATPAASGAPPRSALPPALDANAAPPASFFVADPIASRELRVTKAKLKREHARYLGAHRRVLQLVRVLRQRPSTSEAINLACSIYGSCSTLWRVARCESGYSPTAHNPSGASGLFQFMPGTFAGTPFGRFSIWSPYANALAAGWMFARGRAGAWVCR